MQRTLFGCAFCEAPPGSDVGEAHTWGKDERVTHSICVDCAIQARPAPDERDHFACDGCDLVVNALSALTSFRVELGNLEGCVRLCAHCSPDGPATYWTRDIEEHLVEPSADKIDNRRRGRSQESRSWEMIERPC